MTPKDDLRQLEEDHRTGVLSDEEFATVKQGAWVNNGATVLVVLEVAVERIAEHVKKHGLTLEILYTQGGPESIQAVVSGSMDIGTGVGVSAAVGAFSK